MKKLIEPFIMTDEAKRELAEYAYEVELFEKHELPVLFRQLESYGVKPHEALLAFKIWSDNSQSYRGHTPVEIAKDKYDRLGSSKHATVEILADTIRKVINRQTQEQIEI